MTSSVGTMRFNNSPTTISKGTTATANNRGNNSNNDPDNANNQAGTSIIFVLLSSLLQIITSIALFSYRTLLPDTTKNSNKDNKTEVIINRRNNDQTASITPSLSIHSKEKLPLRSCMKISTPDASLASCTLEEPTQTPMMMKKPTTTTTTTTVSTMRRITSLGMMAKAKSSLSPASNNDYNNSNYNSTAFLPKTIKSATKTLTKRRYFSTGGLAALDNTKEVFMKKDSSDNKNNNKKNNSTADSDATTDTDTAIRTTKVRFSNVSIREYELLLLDDNSKNNSNGNNNNLPKSSKLALQSSSGYAMSMFHNRSMDVHLGWNYKSIPNIPVDEFEGELDDNKNEEEDEPLEW